MRFAPTGGQAMGNYLSNLNNEILIPGYQIFMAFPGKKAMPIFPSLNPAFLGFFHIISCGKIFDPASC